MIKPALPVHPTAGSLARALLAAGRAIAAVRAGRSLATALPAERLTDDIRPQVQDLAYGSLRRYGWGDFIVGRLLDRPLADPTAHGLLLAALYRLETRPESAHAVVDQAVDAAGRLLRGQYRGLTNAVLRNYLRRRDEILAAVAVDDVAANWHPAWWLDRLREAYPADWPRIVASGNEPPPMTLRVNLRRGSTLEYLDELEKAGQSARRVGQCAIRLERPVPVDLLPGFPTGRVSVQDAGAQRAAELLGLVSGQRVLDACAAPGGKSSHVLESADVEMLALDLDAGRCQRISDNFRRLGLGSENVRVISGDARRPESWWDGRFFDRILADVPCSASGVVRRHPDSKWLRRAEDVDANLRIQDELLDALWTVLAPGGRLLYATCSVFPAENVERIEAFLERQPQAILVPVDGAPTLQMLPDVDHDGFFYALLEKAA